jgi:cytochrome c-type biogenesis protein CcmE
MKKTHIVGIILIALAIGSMFTLLTSSTTFSNFADAQKAEEEVQVAGTLVKSKPMTYDPVKNPNLFSFYMVDRNGKESKVVLLDTKPQDFERSQEIVAIGSMKGNEFVAKKLLMKCPSKYNDGREGEWTSSETVSR